MVPLASDFANPLLKRHIYTKKLELRFENLRKYNCSIWNWLCALVQWFGVQCFHSHLWMYSTPNRSTGTQRWFQTEHFECQIESPIWVFNRCMRIFTIRIIISSFTCWRLIAIPSSHHLRNCSFCWTKMVELWVNLFANGISRCGRGGCWLLTTGGYLCPPRRPSPAQKRDQKRI